MYGHILLCSFGAYVINVLWKSLIFLLSSPLHFSKYKHLVIIRRIFVLSFSGIINFCTSCDVIVYDNSKYGIEN